MGISREFGVICMYNRTLKKTKSGEWGEGERRRERERERVYMDVYITAGKKEVMTRRGTKGFQGVAIFYFLILAVVAHSLWEKSESCISFLLTLWIFNFAF